MPTTVDLATADDIPSILKISNWAAAHTVANFATTPEAIEDWMQSFFETHETHPWLVAKESSDVIGFAKAGPWKGRCAYTWSAETSVYIHHDHHRKGVGRALYSKLIAMLEAQGFRTLLAGISLPNRGSVRLHESFGFVKVAEFERVGYKFDKWHNVGYWQHQLVDQADSNTPPGTVRTVAELGAISLLGNVG